LNKNKLAHRQIGQHSLQKLITNVIKT